MSDPIRLPATHITEDVAEVLAAEPYPPVDWDKGGTIAERFDSATWQQLKLLASGIGDPSE